MTTTNTPTSGAADLRTAAQAVVDRWDTPLWKDVPSTAEYIGRLRAALAAGQATAAQQGVAYAELEKKHADFVETVGLMLAAIGYKEDYARQWPKEKASVTFRRWFDEQRASHGQAQADSVQEDACHAPPLGWRCTRKAGHEGPCAAVEYEDDQQFVERGMQRIRDAEDAARYRLLRRGQHWSVINGWGNELLNEALDHEVDAARKQGEKQ